MHCNEEQPPLAAARQTPLAATKTQRSQKKNLFSNQLDVITLRKPLINNYFLYMPVTGLNRQSKKFFILYFDFIMKLDQGLNLHPTALKVLTTAPPREVSAYCFFRSNLNLGH